MIFAQTTSVPSFAIIVPILHSLEDLERCLSSLDGLDYPKERFHVVLVDCHIVDGLKQFSTDSLPKYGFRASALFPPDRSTIGPSWLIESRLNEARNYAIQSAPGLCYVFTEDDCTFEPDWLYKIEAALTNKVGAIGGPDILPAGMGWFPRALDCVLNSYLGTAGMRRGDGRRADEYYPRKQNMAIPAWVLNRVGNFPEEKPVSGEIEMASRIRAADLQVKFLPDNPVWHRRVNSLHNFIQLNAYMASENVQCIREHGIFAGSRHFLVLLATMVGALLGVLSMVNSHVRIFVLALAVIYILALLTCAVSSAVRTHSVSVGLGVLVLMPAHHLSLMFGITKGAITRTKTKKE